MDKALLHPGEARTYLNEDMLEPEVLKLAGGLVAVLSARCPEKTTPNEDAAAVICAGGGAAILAVADGCGGMSAGEQAAKIIIESLVLHVAEAVKQQTGLRAAILDGVEQANRSILEQRNGAAATLAVAQIEDGQVRPYHVGDSQVLMVGGRGKIKLLTTSHSPVGYAVEAGLLDESEAMSHADRHLVSNIVGGQEMHVEIGSQRKMAQRDGVLVASDGLLDNLLTKELAGLLSRGDGGVAATRLGALAWQRMTEPAEGLPSKPDDITLIVYSRRGEVAQAKGTA